MPALSTSLPWTDQQRDVCIQRGCHQSATLHAEFLRDEMAGFIEDRFFIVLPYDIIRHAEQLMLTPCAVKEERERKPRLLCDHSWNWGWPSINEATIPHAPPEAMQFGGALPRILYLIRHANPRFGPLRLSKQDIKDGFYRLFLRVLDCLRMALILPRYEGEPQLIAVPMACTMGWVQSPPTFCTMSETICDLTNHAFEKSPYEADAHRLEPHATPADDLDRSNTPRPRDQDHAGADLSLALPHDMLANEEDEAVPPSNCALSKPAGATDVFMDDFIQLGQGGVQRMLCLRRHLFHCIDQVLARPEVSAHPRNEAVSLKKLQKGDGSWATRKTILGWELDTLRQTIELPAHRKLELASIFADLATAKRVSHKRWQRILGKLRFVSVAIPGSAGLFSALQMALNQSNGHRIRIGARLRQHIDAFSRLAASLRTRPTYLAEIVPQEPTLLGATDAAKAGMGGIYYDCTGQAYLWRLPFPDDIQRRLVSEANPSGSITNSDLEQAGLLAQVSIMADNHHVRYATLVNMSDNTPAVSRIGKGAVSSDGAAAYLCDYASQHQRLHRYCHRSHYLPGDVNVMADDASRLQHLSDSAFLAHFEQEYPQPAPWRLLTLSPENASQLISALLCRSPRAQPAPKTDVPKTTRSATGPSSAPNKGTPLPSVSCAARKIASPDSSSSACATGSKDAPVTLSELAQWIKPYWPWARGYPTWASQIPDSSPQEGSIPYSLLSSRHSETKTHQPAAPTPPTSPSSEGSLTPSTLLTLSGAASTPTSSTSSSSPSSGCSDLPSTWSQPSLKPELKPSNSPTSPSPSEEPSTTLLRHL